MHAGAATKGGEEVTRPPLRDGAAQDDVGRVRRRSDGARRPLF